jgi:hypothetical protein
MPLSIVFHYTDAEWAKIVRELPAVAEPQKLRRELESRVDRVRGDGITDPARHRQWIIKNLRDTANAARKLQKALGSLEAVEIWSPPPIDPDNLDHLASWADEFLQDSSRPGRPVYWNREELVDALLSIWTSNGGELKRSGANGRASSAGPLIRFLIAAAKPAGLNLTVDSARACIGKKKGSPRRGEN